SRYEQASSPIAISKGRVPVLPIGGDGKGIGNTPFTQLRVWNPSKPETGQQGSTMWSNNRAITATDVVDPNKPWHRPETLTHYSEDDGIVTATTRFEKLLAVETPLAERTVVIDPQRETVLVTDRVELAAGLATESNFGLS